MKRIGIVLGLLIGSASLVLPAMAADKVLLVVASRNYLESEYDNTRAALEKAGLGIETASDSSELATGYSSGQIKPDLDIDHADAARYAAVVVIGGYGARDYLWDHVGLRTLVRRVHEQGKWVAALCAAPPVLANAGLLRGEKATMWPDKKWIAVLEAGGAQYVDESVVSGNRVITGKNPAAAPAFGKRIAEAILR